MKYEFGKYFVNKNGRDEWEILKHEPWYVTDANITIGDMFWEKCPKFDSFIRAVAWLKENAQNLL